MQVALSLLLLPLLLSGVLSKSCSGTCRSGAQCCCTGSQGDPSQPNVGYCPCQAYAPAAVVGSSLTISCDPGFPLECRKSCEWRTPTGNCNYDGTKWSCDPSVTGVDFLNNACDIKVLVTTAHLGNWTCLSRPFSGRRYIIIY